MRAALGPLAPEEGLSALTAGTAATAVAVLYCGIGGSDVFLILVGIFALGVAGFSASARWTGQRKLLRFAQWLQWANLALFFLVGVLICAALSGNFHWAYAHPAARPARLLTGLLDMVGPSADAWPSSGEETLPEVWAMGGGLRVNVEEKCQFPFTFEGKTFQACATGVGPPPTGSAWSVEKDRQYPWCMTNIPEGRWGYCLKPGAWDIGSTTRETVVHSRVTVPHQAVVLLFVVLCQLVISPFSIGILDALEVEESQERRFKEGWRGYGALDTHAPGYAPGYASAYAPPSYPTGSRVAPPRSQPPPDAVFHPANAMPR